MTRDNGLPSYVHQLAEFYDGATGRCFILAILRGERWLLWKHPDGQWVTWRRPTEQDEESIMHAFKATAPATLDTAERDASGEGEGGR